MSTNDNIIGIISRGSDTSKETINSIISDILVNSTNVDGVVVPAHGAISRAGRKFGVSKYTVSRIFGRAKKIYENNKKKAFTASPLKKGRVSGTNQKWSREEVAEAVAQLPFNKRNTMAAISSSLSIPKTSVHRMYRQDGIIVHNKNIIKPTLTDQNKFFRVLYCFDKIQGVRENSLFFRSNHSTVPCGREVVLHHSTTTINLPYSRGSKTTTQRTQQTAHNKSYLPMCLCLSALRQQRHMYL
jgi:hypothetical protein